MAIIPDWTRVNGEPTWIYSTEYDATHDILYVGLYTGGPNGGGVYSYNGTTWVDITAGTGLDVDIVWCLLYVPEQDLLYAGTYNGGVWTWDGANWVDLGGAIANYEVWSLTYDPVNDLVYCGTGNWTPDNGMSEGVWKWDGANWTRVSSIIGSANKISAENSSFEGGTTGTWSVIFATCTLANSVAWASVGTHSMKITPVVGKRAWCGLNVTAVTSAASPYTVIVKFKGVAGKVYQLLTYDNVTGQQAGTAITGTGAEQRICWTGEFGAGSTYRRIDVYNWELGVGGDDFYIDDIQVLDDIDVATLSVTYLAFDYNHNILYAAPETFYSDMAGVWACVDPDTAPAWTQFDTSDIATDHLQVITYDPIGDILYAGAYQNVGVNDPLGIFSYDGSTWEYIGMANHSVWNLSYDPVLGTLYLCSCRRDSVAVASVWARKHGKWNDITGVIPTSNIRAVDVTGDGLYVTTWDDGVWFANNPEFVVYVRERRHTQLYIQITDIYGRGLTRLTELISSASPSQNAFEGLTFESVNPGGFTVANFTIHRPVTQYWGDLQHRNSILIGAGADTYWEGYVDSPSRSINPDTVDVACQGWSAQLNQLWTRDDLTVTGAGDNQMSDFITSVVLADTDILIKEGVIDTDDYTYASTTKFEFAPATYYFDCLDQLNAANNYDWGVWLGKQFYFNPKTPTIVNWLVWVGDCSDLSIQPNPEALCNYCLVHYTQDGSHYQDIIVQDTDSQNLYGIYKKKVDVPGRTTTANATQIGNTYIADCKDLKVSAEFTCCRVYDIYGAEHHLGEVRGGHNIRLVDWIPTEETLNQVDNIATFQIKSPKYSHDDYSLSVTPTEFSPRTDIAIARLQAVGY